MKRSATLLSVVLVVLTWLTRFSSGQFIPNHRLPITPTSSLIITTNPIPSDPSPTLTLSPLLPHSFGQSTIVDGKSQITTIISTLQNRTVTIIGQ